MTNIQSESISIAWNNPHWQEGFGPSAELLEIAKARLARIDAAIALGTVFSFRLTAMRSRLICKMNSRDGLALSAWLAEFGDAIVSECKSAERAAAARLAI